LSAPTNNRTKVARARQEAIKLANELNGARIEPGTLIELIDDYFDWQESLSITDARRKTADTLKENRRETKNLKLVFGKMAPAALTKVHIYQYMELRAKQGAPAKSNKEVALLSAVYNYGVRIGRVTENPCRDLEYIRTTPSTKLVARTELSFAEEVARQRGGAYVVVVLCLKAAYLTVSRPDETRAFREDFLSEAGVEIPVGKRKGHEARKVKLATWTKELKAVIDEALRIRRALSPYIFCTQDGQIYTRSGFSTTLRRLMAHCEKRAAEVGFKFNRFALRDMRAMATTQKMERRDDDVQDATAHVDDRMIRLVYDRRRTRTYSPTE
jgi:integrase